MIDDLKILAVIPARGGSKGIPLKNIKKLCGTPLVVLAGQVASAYSDIDRVVVSTDHKKIMQVCKEAGISTPFERPAELSGDRVSDVPVLRHALLEMEHLDKVVYDIVVMLQPTSPMRTVTHISNTISKLVDENLDAVWTVSETDSKSHPLKQLVVNNGLLDYYDSQGANIIARQQLKPVYHRNGLVYALRREFLLNNDSLKSCKTGALVVDGVNISIDTEWDFKLTELIWSEFDA